MAAGVRVVWPSGRVDVAVDGGLFMPWFQLCSSGPFCSEQMVCCVPNELQVEIFRLTALIG